MNRSSAKKKQWIILGIIAAVFVVLIAGVLVAGKMGVFGKDESDETPKNIEEKDGQSEIIDGIEIEEGKLPLEDVMAQAAGYEDIYDRFQKYYDTLFAEDSWTEADMAVQDDMAVYDEMEAYEGDVYDPAKVISFSYVPEYEVDAGSIYKTDGTYAYFVRNDGAVRIMKLDGESMEHMSLISEFAHEMEFVLDLHVIDDRLVLITSYTEIIDETVGSYREGTLVYTYDITNREYPTLIGSVEVEGYYMGSRIVDSNVYVYSNCYKDGFIANDGSLISMEDLDLAAYVPTVNDQVIAAENVYIPVGIVDATYFTCVSVDMENPGEVKDAKAFLSVESQYYAGENGIYLTMRNGLYSVKDTMIIRLDFTDGMVVPMSAGAVDGYVLGREFISEKNGQLRVVSSNATKEGLNQLYVFADDFQIVTKKDNLAAGEQIQASRFIDDTVYLATYGEKPISIVTLSDSENIAEEMVERVNGFDGLLYEFGEGKILGIMYILNAETLVNEGVRISAFDVADPSEIKVMHSVDIKTDTTPVLGDVTGLFLDEEKGLIGLATEDWDDTYSNVDNYYHLFQYTPENGFQKVLETRLGAGSCWYARGFAIEDSFYVAEQDSGTIRSFDMLNAYAQIGEMYY